MNINEPKTSIIFQSPRVFVDTTNSFKEVGKFPNYRLEDGVVSQDSKVSSCANTCSILGMYNGKDIYEGHFAPELKRGDFLQKLDYIIKKFQDATGMAEAVVVGGWDYNIGTKEAKDSFELSCDIGNVLDKNDVPTSMFCAKRKPKYTEALAVTKDGFFITHNKKIGTKSDFLPTEPTKEELEEILSNNYEIFEIAPEHNIFFKDK